MTQSIEDRATMFVDWCAQAGLLFSPEAYDQLRGHLLATRNDALAEAAAFAAASLMDGTGAIAAAIRALKDKGDECG
jgi:hypothetical protein